MISTAHSPLKRLQGAGILGLAVAFGPVHAQPAAASASQDSASAMAREIETLKASLQAQREQLEAQKRQLGAQEAQLREQEKALQALSVRSGGVAPAATGAQAPASESLSTPARSEDPTRKEALAQPSGPEPVTTRFDGIKVLMGGALRTTVNTTTARMQPDATPFFVLPQVPGTPSGGSTKVDARLSSLLFSIEGAQLGDFKLGGTIYAYLFNGDLLSGQYGFYPGFAYVDATSERWRFAAGLQMDVFSPRIPTMVDRMSAFAGSGNPGNSFKPQLRAEHIVPLGRDRITVQGALADAMPSNIKLPSESWPDAASVENTGMPNVEARLAWTRGRPGEDNAWVPWPALEIGLSGVVGKYRTFSLVNAFPAYTTKLSGVALEGGWRIGQRLGIQGELYKGRALGPYLGAIFQTDADGKGIASHGGWGEAAWWWTPTLHSHVGYGADYADAGAFASNKTAFVNLFWDPSRKTTLAIEATWRQTGYRGLGDFSGYSLMLSSELRF